MKVVIGGGSGFLGRALVRSLAAEGHEAVVVSRSGTVTWDGVDGAIDGADAVVNLAGTSIGGPRWTDGRKQSILESRVQTTERLVDGIARATAKPGVFVCASGIGFAGDSRERFVDEQAPYGRDFLARVCEAWEAAAARAPVRSVLVRNAFVIGRGAPALRLMALPHRLFLGGPVGGGRQWFPWIHLEDAVAVYRRAIDDPTLSGPVNAVAPQLVRQRQLAKAIGDVLHRPSWVPTPALALRTLLGEQADLLLHGQRAVSAKLGGFDFRYPELRAALNDALR